MLNIRHLVLCIACVIAAGCSSGGSDLNKKDNQVLRDNLSRPLNEEEIKMMGKGNGAQKAGSQPAQMPAGKGPKR